MWQAILRVARERPIVARVAVLVAAGLAFSLTHLSLGVWLVDDAGITYTYAMGLADHGSFSALPESAPVEGYSNPLMFWLVASLHWLGLFDPIGTHTKIELVAFAVMALLVFELLRARMTQRYAVLGTAIFIGVELATPATWLWYSSGLENVFVSLGAVTLLFLGDRVARTGTIRPVSVGVLCFVVALVRPEAPFYVAAFYGVLPFTRNAEAPLRTYWIRLVSAGAITSGLYIAYLVWRHDVYGAWVSNTYFAKLSDGPALGRNISDYVVPEVFRYAEALVFALSAIVVGLAKRQQSLALMLGALTVASLVMPVVGGNDWMGEHRHATGFFAMGHVTLAIVVPMILVIRQNVADTLIRRALVVMPLLPVFAHTIILGAIDPKITNVTIPRVFELHGVQRLQHQRRVGVINPVVVVPDAGGTRLMGSLQHIDNGYLTDFQMAHMLRDLRVMTQYQTRERRADFADRNPNWATMDMKQLGPVYLAPSDAYLATRRDLVELAAPPTIPPFYEHTGLRLYLAPDNVLLAGPNGLLRVEIVVEWAGGTALHTLTLKASLGGDFDDISLQPYGVPETSAADVNGAFAPAARIQRRALLVRAPAFVGRHTLTLELLRDGATLSTFPIEIEVMSTARVAGFVDTIVRRPGSSPDEVMRRLAWLREQSIPRLSQVALRSLQRKLLTADRMRNRNVARRLELLRWDGRLAALTDEVPTPIRAAEHSVVEPMFDRCAGISGAHRTLCLGRVIDHLRRYGYFGVVARIPTLTATLHEALRTIDQQSLDDRYVTLVGLSLAMPESIDVQKRLVTARDAFVTDYWHLGQGPPEPGKRGTALPAWPRLGS